MIKLINYNIKFEKTKTIIETNPTPLFYEEEKIKYDVNNIDIKINLNLIGEKINEQMQSGAIPKFDGNVWDFPKKENVSNPAKEKELQLLKKIRNSYIKHLNAIIEIDREIAIDKVTIHGRNEEIKKAEKTLGIKHPHDFVWVDGCEKETGVIIFPRDIYSKVYVVKGSLEKPEIEFLEEYKEGQKNIKPYYEKKDGKTYVYMDGFSGAGTEQDPWEISSPADLQNIGRLNDTGNDWSDGLDDDGNPTSKYDNWSMDDYYILTNDIDWSEHFNDKFKLLMDGEGYIPFTGEFNGNGKTIYNLVIGSSETVFASLFGIVLGTVKNLNLHNVDIQGFDYASGIAIMIGSGGLIENCKVHGQIDADFGFGNGMAGGIVAFGLGITSGIPIKIKNCTNQASVNGVSLSGGIIGMFQVEDAPESLLEIIDCFNTGAINDRNFASGILGTVWVIAGGTINISNCINEGNITCNTSETLDMELAGGITTLQLGGDNPSITINNCSNKGNITGNTILSCGIFGGVIANPESSINNCYNLGSITTPDGLYSCGIVGSVTNQGEVSDCYNQGELNSPISCGILLNNNGGKVKRCYSTGKLISTQEEGGIALEISTGSVDEDNYWDVETSETTESALGTGKTTAEMKDINTYFPEWDIVEKNNYNDDAWYIDDGNDYPKLGWELKKYTIFISKEGNGSIEINGSSVNIPCEYVFYKDAEIEDVEIFIKAFSGSQYLFNKWVINGIDNFNNPTSIAISENTTIAIYFLPISINDYINALKSKVREPIIKIEFLDGNEDTISSITPDLLDGSLDINKESGIRRKCSFSLKNDDKVYIPEPEGNLWINTKFKLYTGLKVDDEDYFVSRGIFVISNPELNSYLAEKTASITALDKFALLDGTLAGELDAEYIIDVGTDLEVAVRAVFEESGEIKPVIIDPISSIQTPYTIIKSPGDTFADILRELADMVSMKVFFDKNGYPRFKKTTDLETVGSIWDFTTEEFLYLGSTRRYEFDKIRNHILVIGDNINGETFRALAIDSNITSPTRVDLIGKRVKVINDDLIYTNALAQMRADYELQENISLYDSVDLRSIPIDIIDEENVITLTDEANDLDDDRFLINSIRFPLSFDGEMGLNVWRVMNFE